MDEFRATIAQYACCLEEDIMAPIEDMRSFLLCERYYTIMFSEIVHHHHPETITRELCGK